MAIKAYEGKCNINSAEKGTSNGDWTWGLVWTHFDANLTELTKHCFQDWDF